VDTWSDVEELHRRARTALTDAHRRYTRTVLGLLAERNDVILFESGYHSPGLPRTTVAWTDGVSPTFIEWTETHGWAVHHPEHAPGEVFTADLPIVADPHDAATWISAALSAEPAGVTARTPRRQPTRQADVSSDVLLFEKQLVLDRVPAWGRWTARRVRPPANASLPEWDLALTQRCLGCPDGASTVRPWTLETSRTRGRFVVDPRDAVIYTAVCERCHPDAVYLSRADIDRYESRLAVLPQTRRERLDAAAGETVWCPSCRHEWVRVLTGSFPLVYGGSSRSNPLIHPCLWCWERDGAQAARDLQQALTFRW
jgi:hypothetical protein